MKNTLSVLAIADAGGARRRSRRHAATITMSTSRASFTRPRAPPVNPLAAR